MKLLLLTVILTTTISSTTCNGIKTIHEKPKRMGDAIGFDSLKTHKTRVQNKILKAHNYYRSIVKPPASNMLKMTWHKGAAKAAQNWSESCVYLKHDNNTNRFTKNLGNCGQNIFVSSLKVPWIFVVKSWFNEFKDFNYGRCQQNGVIGHYTQLVWATSHKIGCFVAKCQKNNGKVFFNYVCDYCPSGNIVGLQHVPYRKGRSCSACKNDCHNNLCSNSCPFLNNYSNCNDLFKQNPKKVCATRLRASCKATCKCKNKIFQKYNGLNTCS